ncbi:effector-associated domain EAD1-containing protein [Dactylosporangium siamense]|nr:effector-associated domain EAD1-containing protein [Dactylosporangium siamense]
MRQPDRRAYLPDYGDEAESLLPAEDQIDWQDRDRLLLAMARLFPTQTAAAPLLRSIRVPAEHIPPWGDGDAESWWTSMFAQLDNGLLSDPYRRLIGAAHRRYRRNTVLSDLFGRYLTEDPQTPEMCHVFVRAGTDGDRTNATEVLEQLGLRPVEDWRTDHTVSFSVNTADHATVGRLLHDTQLGFTVVPPGQANYLLRELYVQGPDGSRFRLVDAPAQQTVGAVAGEVVSHQYQDDDEVEANRPTVVDKVDGRGDLTRVGGDQTLDEAGFEEGDNMRIGWEGRAGAVNPVDWQNALDRVYKQIRLFAEGHPDVKMWADSMSTPTEYEIAFRRKSFAPPEHPGQEPAVIEAHKVRIALGADFPEVAPNVFWLTPIFHPNVFPMYDCEAARGRPDLRGFVCLGMLAESWQPALDFGDLIQTLIDIAGYRNYELYQVSTGRDGPMWRANYFDRDAARWANDHQAAIVGIGGSTLVPHHATRPGYPNVIIPVD